MHKLTMVLLLESMFAKKMVRYAGGEDLRHVLLSAAEQGECSARDRVEQI